MYAGIRLDVTDSALAEPALRSLRHKITKGLRAGLALGSQLSVRTRHGQTIDVRWRMPLRAGRSLLVNVKIELLLEDREGALYVIPSVSDHAHVEGAGSDATRWAPTGTTARSEWRKFTARIEQVVGEIFNGEGR